MIEFLISVIVAVAICVFAGWLRATLEHRENMRIIAVGGDPPRRFQV